MPASAIRMEKDTCTSKIQKQKIKLFKFKSDVAESNFTMTLHSKLILIYSTLCFSEPKVQRQKSSNYLPKIICLFCTLRSC